MKIEQEELNSLLEQREELYRKADNDEELNDKIRVLQKKIREAKNEN